MSMSTKDTHKQKIEAEIELAQTQLAKLKAQAKSYAADPLIIYTKQVDELEQDVDATRVKLKELVEDSGDDWEQFRGGVESAWGALLRFA